jgi:hypothetical protein
MPDPHQHPATSHLRQLKAFYDVFTARGIRIKEEGPAGDRARAVVSARGYTPYRGPEKDAAPGRTLDAGLADIEAVEPRLLSLASPGAKRAGSFVRWVVRASDGVPGGGWVMPRHSVLPDLENPMAQLRPHKKGGISQGPPRRHSHGQAFRLWHRRSRKWVPLTISRERHETGAEHVQPDGQPVQIEHYDPATGKGYHAHPRLAKYVLPPDDGTESKRLDRNPLTTDEDFRIADVVFFVIEGVLKTDAITAAGEAAFGVPSVTLWRAEPETDDMEGWPLPTELERFIEHAIRGPIVIVPDADWRQKEDVILQAVECRDFLEELGCVVTIAAPPVSAGQKGVDDYLGQVTGASPRLLEIVEWETPPGLADFDAAYRAAREGIPGRNPADRDLAILRALIRYSSADGYARRARKPIIRSLHREAIGAPPRGWEWLGEAIDRLEKAGAFSVVEPQKTEEFTRPDGQLGFRTPPPIIQLAPALRWEAGEPRTVSEWLTSFSTTISVSA